MSIWLLILETILGYPQPSLEGKTYWSYLKDMIWKAMQGWEKKNFSMGGKEVLIRSIGQAIPSYAMSVFRLPKGFCYDISRMFAHF